MKDFNFFSPYIKTKKESIKKYIYITGIILIFLTTVSGIYVYMDQKEKQLKQEIASMEKYLNLEEVLEKAKNMEDKKRRLALLEKYYKAIIDINTKIDKLDVIHSMLMEQISSTLPKDVVFNDIAIEGYNLKIQGNAQSRNSIAELEYNFKNLDIFKQVHVSIIDKDIQEEKIQEEIKEESKEEINIKEIKEEALLQEELPKETIIIKDKGYAFSLKCVLKDVNYD